MPLTRVITDLENLNDVEITAPEDGQALVYDSGQWVNDDVVGGGGNPDWGDINGTLSDQTDLQAALDAKAPTASPAFTGTVSLPPGLTGVLRADSGAVSVDANVTDIVTEASDVVSGKVELATTAETTTGTDATRAVTPDGLHDMTSLAGAAWFLDEDNFASDSATKVPSQQSTKAYVDAQVISAGAGDVVGPAASVDSEIALFSSTTGKLLKRATTSGMLKGTSGVISAGTAGTDYTTPSSTESFTNKTFNANGSGNNITNIEVADFAAGVVDTDISSVSGSDDTLASAKAIKTALDLKQTLDSDLTTIAGLTPSDNDFLVRNASAWANRTPAQAIAHLGLDADIATLALPANTTISTFGATLVDDASATAAIATLGLDADIATLSLPSGTTISAFGAILTSSAAASNARTSLGVAVGSDVQAYNAGTHKTAVSFLIDGGGSAITTGVKGDLQLPDWAGTIVRVTMLADQSGSIVVDLWKDTYANYPPTGADAITASAKPTISATTKSTDATLTGWTTSFSALDTLRFNVDSVTTITRVTIVLHLVRS